MKPEPLGSVTTDQLETTLTDLESRIAACRHLQMRLLGEIDQRQVPIADGSRNLSEWVASRLDVTPETAQRLTQTARRLTDQPGLAEELAEGGVSFDRIVEESRLVAAGARAELVAMSRGWDLTGLRRQTARHQRISRPHEQHLFSERFLSMQPTLDQTSYKLWGQVPGTDGQIIHQALTQKADQFPAMNLPGFCGGSDP